MGKIFAHNDEKFIILKNEDLKELAVLILMNNKSISVRAQTTQVGVF